MAKLSKGVEATGREADQSPAMTSRLAAVSVFNAWPNILKADLATPADIINEAARKSRRGEPVIN